ncbi:Scr1 family TA system antitoxin-like transcriptional regulator [Streptomyces sp. NBC_01221]|uniref:Scr1 family TA system antitoxin-like transcriptional regulator n=1 Tax=Streptomyces sp. NBC_01221 TaxID=2903782 RepID=UPI002B1E3C7F|nr:Scr1 family TA system antitoxin-like transcriptional regulator [Streptomyces sp. NBC_01221]
MAGGRRARHWWDEYRGKLPDGHLDVSEIEHFATRIRTAQTVHLPGLFQIEEHARAIFDFAVPQLPRLEVELRVEVPPRSWTANVYAAWVRSWAARALVSIGVT